MLDLSAENVDYARLLTLVQQRDPLGVLSIYVDGFPGNGRDSGRTTIDIKNRLAELERRLDIDTAPDRARVVRAALGESWAEIERLLDPHQRGRGRALFIPLSAGEPARFSSQLALPNRVVLDESAFIHPLLELVDEGRSTGIVLLSRREANLLEWRFGELRCLGRVPADAPEASHERPGPVGPSPSSSHSTPTREQREAQERSKLQTLLAETASAVRQLAGYRSWERLLVSGGGRLLEPLVHALPPRLRRATVRETRALGFLERAELEAEITEVLLADNRDRELRLIETVRESAAALGLSEVLAALNEGRVGHLIYDPGVRYEGSIDDHGRLYRNGESPSANGDSVHEPRMTERIVERCLRTGARISPVEGASAGALAEAEGIAAILRW